MILRLGLKPKIPDQRKQFILDCSEFMFILLGISRVPVRALYERKGKLAFRSKVLMRVLMFRVFERS